MTASKVETARRLPRAALVIAVLLVSGVGLILSGTLDPPWRRAAAHRDLAERWGREYGIDPALVLAVVAVESGGDPAALSPAGARGLMQLMPATAEDMAEQLGLEGFTAAQLDDPELNLRLGTRYLRWLADRFGEDRPATILAAYNAGYGTVTRWLSDISTPSGTRPTDEQLLGRIEYAETRQYVSRVKKTWGRTLTSTGL